MDFVIFWKLILKRSLSAFAYTFLIFFVVGFIVMASLLAIIDGAVWGWVAESRSSKDWHSRTYGGLPDPGRHDGIVEAEVEPVWPRRSRRLNRAKERNTSRNETRKQTDNASSVRFAHCRGIMTPDRRPRTTGTLPVARAKSANQHRRKSHA